MFANRNYISFGNTTDLLSASHLTQSLSSSSVFNTEPTLRELRTSQNTELRSLSSSSNDSSNIQALSSATVLPQSTQYNQFYGDGLINAAAAVARSLNRSTFPNVTNYGSYNWGLDAIQAPEVWARGYTGDDIVVAVLDTGVDFTHADLDNNIWINWGETFGNGIDDDRNGYIDDIVGWNFINNNNNPMDYDGHGTHVAGIIAAENNFFGTTGVAFNSKIMPVRVLGENGGMDQSVAQGIIYATNNGADVINLSLGSSGYSSEIAAAVRYATEQGAIVVMAAGNSGASEPFYPANLATNWGIAVGAIDYYGYVANFSNKAGTNSGLRYVVAPGVDVYSTTPNNTYRFLNGTSMATPYVSGVAALMLSANPYLSSAQVRQILAETAIG